MAGMGRRTRRIAIAAAVAIVAGGVVLARRLPVASWAGGLAGWVEGLGPWGPLAFGVVYVVAVLLMVPTWPLTMAAGAAFGVVKGTVTASVASTTGAALAFLIARHLARERVARRLGGHPRFQALDRAIGRGEWRVVALLRLSPAVPFNLQNYAYGLTRIDFWPCVLTSWLTMLPGTVLYVTLGRAGRLAAGSGRRREPAEWALLAVGLVATVVVTAYLARLSRRELATRIPTGPHPGPLPGGEGGR
jgi:uncharacterized membrane protein YdjX (TVP38/TMEM64 family)